MLEGSVHKLPCCQGNGRLTTSLAVSSPSATRSCHASLYPIECGCGLRRGDHTGGERGASGCRGNVYIWGVYGAYDVRVTWLRCQITGEGRALCDLAALVGNLSISHRASERDDPAACQKDICICAAMYMALFYTDVIDVTDM